MTILIKLAVSFFGTLILISGVEKAFHALIKKA